MFEKTMIILARHSASQKYLDRPNDLMFELFKYRVPVFFSFLLFIFFKPFLDFFVTRLNPVLFSREVIQCSAVWEAGEMDMGRCQFQLDWDLIDLTLIHPGKFR